MAHGGRGKLDVGEVDLDNDVRLKSRAADKVMRSPGPSSAKVHVKVLR